MGCGASTEAGAAKSKNMPAVPQDKQQVAVATTKEVVKKVDPPPAAAAGVVKAVEAAVAPEESDPPGELDCNAAPGKWKEALQAPDAATMLSQLGKLHVKACELTEVPAEALKAPLVELEIGENRIKDFSSLAALKNLRWLDVTGDNRTAAQYDQAALSTLPEFPKLETLHLYGNDLPAIPEIVLKYPTLTDLNLCHNKVMKIQPDLALDQLKAVEELNLSSNKIMQIPPSIGQMTAMRVLKLQMNRIVRLPSLADMKNLEIVHLQCNSLLEFPTFGEHPNLVEINVTRNQLEELAPFNPACFPNLETLELDGNRLKSLPPVLGQLKKLQKLNADGNSISSIDPGVFPEGSQMKVCMLQSNQLEALPDTMGNCTELATLLIQGNKLATLPAGLGAVKTLSKVSMKDNPFSGDAQPVIAAIRANVFAHDEKARRWDMP